MHLLLLPPLFVGAAGGGAGEFVDAGADAGVGSVDGDHGADAGVGVGFVFDAGQFQEPVVVGVQDQGDPLAFGGAGWGEHLGSLSAGVGDCRRGVLCWVLVGGLSGL